uniref:Uncharacterized protein n=1 Tax=viral metagenome TaxID=1070528 RepID=A0A6M3KMU8_9ZZZZ
MLPKELNEKTLTKGEKTMSFLTIMKGGKEKTFRIEDGKSNLLNRFVSLDSGDMWYFLGKQISGRTINRQGKLGQGLWYVSNLLWERDKG